MVRSATGDAVIAQVAARLFVEVTRRAPVDTGKYRGGMNYRLDRTRNGARMVFTNVQGYAVYVEELWAPIGAIATKLGLEGWRLRRERIRRRRRFLAG